ncbi:CPBP family intramembrane glutamic endopeptidase [Acetanaerobacterium elongatum]|uniref:CAAX protease self-immunity n=1 Tax=Acetanaerobacterium elongatum TaxID=258515 RepID=A0A1G9VA91_9FIRM|nr:type II CAAX endopeptidase family protein [Acetanaerobacterium elongatum]SDM69089.1 CAAX protease self-immunity [Acetanaerobacterium elongatum]
MEDILLSGQGTDKEQKRFELAQAAARVGTAVSIWVGLRLIFLLIDVIVTKRLQAAGISDSMLQIVDLALSAVGVYFVATPIALWALGMFKEGRFKALFAKSRMSGKEFAAAVPMGYTVTIGVNLIATVVMIVASGSLQQVLNSNPILNMPKGTLGIALNYVWAVLAAPIFEELLFRGGLVSTLKPFGNWFAVLVSAVLFGFAHGSVAQMLYATALGIVLGMVFIKSGSVIPCMLMHLIINFLGITISSLYSPERLGLVAIIGLLVMAVLIAGIVLIIVTLVNYRHKLSLGNGCTILTRGEKLSGLFKSAPVILMLLLTVIFLVLVTVPGLLQNVTSLIAK